ncbi:M3 family metallopeptidase [uncultured Piscinibacter sp.]|uniref:M3 family metallopeptidase n=1 Tax=uncultured Piscinibacter sp. TaxID=1131835 RepID=UPI0026101BDD|nr:M3 family metallopeptidase [uncultured Piscinibacter sp.]
MIALPWRRLVALAVVLFTQAAAAQVYEFPRYDSATQVGADCERLLADLKQRARDIETLPEAGADVLGALDGLMQRVEDTMGPLWLLPAVHPDKAVRDAADACDLAYQGFSTAFLQNAKVHARLQQAAVADDIDRRLQREQLDAFEDSGVALPAAAQQRARRINAELTRLAQDFDRRIRESRDVVAYDEDELEGVPVPVWKNARRDARGRVLLGLDYPTAEPVMQRALRERTRERMWRATMRQGGAANLKTLERLAQLRREYAKLFGFDSYADFALRRRMVGSEDQASRFLAEVQQAVAQRERSDLALLREAKAQATQQPLQATRLQRWDVMYFIERLRGQRYAVDQEAFRPHFPPQRSLEFVFALSQRLFGVRFEPVAQTLWHPQAQAYAARDENGALLGTLFVDLYPRADKYNHAAVWSFRNVSTKAGRLPAAALVVNFNDQGLTLAELETLLHEFGHALHALLSTTRYALQGGTNVQLDFAEAPSQMLEDWVYDPAVLALFGRICAECPPLPRELIERADRARHFAKGIATARQLVFARYDLALHGRRQEEPMRLWARMEGATPLGHVPGTMFPANFSHVAGGYSAGYYAYMWSLVVAEDLRTAFAADRTDPATGRRYRDTVLAQGGQVAPEELVRRFLGRPGNRDAFFRSLNQQ